MNIVKGVADLIRRSSSGPAEDLASGPQDERFTPPHPRIRFSEVGDEAILYTLWERFQKETEKEEKKKLFRIFLKQLLMVHKNWEPIDSGQLAESALSSNQPTGYQSDADSIVIGCSMGHPALMIYYMTLELGQITAWVTELNAGIVQSNVGLSVSSSILSLVSEGIPLLEAVSIITRSMHNCKIFGYYGGVQKLTALMKGAVVQLKTFSGALAADENLSDIMVERIKLLQMILLHIVRTICNFVGCDLSFLVKAHLGSNVSYPSYPGSTSASFNVCNVSKSLPEIQLHWNNKAILSIMEAGGLNWLVELLRVIRRLWMKEQWTDLVLQLITLKAVWSALSRNPRGQNHFKSIGGLEVLLDGLGLPTRSTLLIGSTPHSTEKRDESHFLKLLQLHVLSLEVLREAVLQFLCENGRVQKFANSFCSPVFIFQEYEQHDKTFSGQNTTELPAFDLQNKVLAEKDSAGSLTSLPYGGLYYQIWADYVVRLSHILCSFLLLPEDDDGRHGVQAPLIQISPSISLAYGELSVKWVLRVLATVFPCLTVCSDQNDFPRHIRVFMTTLQHYVLVAFRKALTSSSIWLEIFRDEGIWELLFSENFFYSGLLDKSVMADTGVGEGLTELSGARSSEFHDIPKEFGAIYSLQMEIISFVEFAAMSNGSVHNLPEISVLLDALEQSVHYPDLTCVLVKSLGRILHFSREKTVASFKSLDAISRLLKVVYVLAQEFRKTVKLEPASTLVGTEVSSARNTEGVDYLGRTRSWKGSVESSMDLFSEFLLIADDAKSSILCSTLSIDCLFDLFWEEELRTRVLNHILDLMKNVPSPRDDKSILYLCSKYLETFAQIKERETSFIDLAIILLVGIRDVVHNDPEYYQAIFRDGGCFLHVVSLLNGISDMVKGEELVLNVLQTLTCLLANNDGAKATFRSLVGTGYQTLQSLLLDSYISGPSEGLLNALLDMLVDGKFDLKSNPIIKNDDVIILYLRILQKSSEPLHHYGLNAYQLLLRDSISNLASSVRAGVVSFLLDWFLQEENDIVIIKIAQLVQVVGGHSISGKDIRKIFALLRSEKIGSRQQYCSLLLTSVLSMLNERGPTAFFDLSGIDSGIKISTPILWPLNRGFSFSCWLRIESFRSNGAASLFSFLSDNGRGCLAMVSKDKILYETLHVKQQLVQLKVSLVQKKWHHLCITHSIGRAFSGGSLLRCYLDGVLVSSERCRYAKVNEPLTNSSIGANFSLPVHEEISPEALNSLPFHGQIGPIYLFNDALSAESVQAIYFLGPSYMYSFYDNESLSVNINRFPSGILDAKDGLVSKVIFALNAQASAGKKLFNATTVLEYGLERKLIEATVLRGTQLCSRRLLQQIIYCVGGVSVFFPLIAQSERYDHEEIGQTLLTPITRERLTAEVIELIACVLDENLANQQQMHIVSGFSILGFLLRSVPPQQLNLETLSALKHLFNVLVNCGLAEILVTEAITAIFLDPLIWVYTSYRVQRELYMFLIQQFDNDPRLQINICRLPWVLDMIRIYYWNVKSRLCIGSKPLLHPFTKEIIGERPSLDDIHKIRLLLLSLGEMSLRQNVVAADISALVAFFENSQDMACIEDSLHMVIRAISQKTMLISFLEQVNAMGGCHIFLNLLQREYEPIRLLSLQFLGRLLVGVPLEKKGTRFFSLGSGRSKQPSEALRSSYDRMQPLLVGISERLFKFPLTDGLCAALFDILLGGASPKQVLQKNSSKGSSSQFYLPQVLVLIFRFLSLCEEMAAKIRILRDLNGLVDSNPANIEALMEHGWSAMLTASVKLEVLKDYQVDHLKDGEIDSSEQHLMRNLFCVILSHQILAVKGGWQHLEDATSFLLMQCEQGGQSYRHFLRDLFDDIVQRLVGLSSVENIFLWQPCRDNTLYLLRLIDELLMSELDNKLPFPASSSDFTLFSLDLDSHKEFNLALRDLLQGESSEQSSRKLSTRKLPSSSEAEAIDDKWWDLYDNLWVVFSEMNGKGPSKAVAKASSIAGPSFGQRARGLVESLNIPAAEMAAAVVSGGITNALGGRTSKLVDKALVLRGEKCPRIVFRLVILYLCRSSLERASRCVQQFILLLPCLLVSDDEQSKMRLQLFIWALLSVRSRYGILDDGARFHVMSHLIRETVNCGKSMLITSIAGRDDSSDGGSNSKETNSIHNLIQKDRVLAAVADEAKYMKSLKSDRDRQLHDLHARLEENSSLELDSMNAFEDELKSSLNSLISSDEARKAAFLLSHDEQQQNVTDKWMHVLRKLMDERGPWSAGAFPHTSVRHWKLDKTEDRWRRRQKLRQNYHFDEKLCHPPYSTPQDEPVPPTNESKYGFVGHIPEQMKQFLLKGVHGITDELSSEVNEDEDEVSVQRNSAPENVAGGRSSDIIDSSDHNDGLQDKMDSSASSAEAEMSEVLIVASCVLVTPKRKIAGRLAVLKSSLHFFGELLVEGSGGSILKNLPLPNNSDSFNYDHRQKVSKWSLLSLMESDRGITVGNPESFSGKGNRGQLKNMKRYRRWSIDKIKSVHWTRYLLQYTAIEIFFNDSSAPVFFNFASQKDAKEIGTLIVTTRNDYLFPKGTSKEKSAIITFVDRRVAVEMAETARDRWRRREITNFEYLMLLNTLAGRSYNDITQYPVFPWILADYSSEFLDFNKSSTFRDLSKPIGALDLKRFEVFEDRYRNFSDPDIPSFYYGSHYSSMGIVLYYLLRLEPFTALHQNLQGGKFDHADRLFQSIEVTYKNCLSNTSDVKELVPEFFYMPEFLLNSNSYYIGVKQDGEPIGDVCLPPWAKGSPDEFINKNREALESEYVSSNLHHWIDLIFGYKQRGKPAVEAANVFYYLTYEGAVDLESTEDDLQRSAIEDQIANFGQTPIQIFRKKHPRRGPPIPILHPLHFAPSSIGLTSVVSSTVHPPSSVLYVGLLDSNIVLVNQGLTLSVKMWLTTQLQSGGNFTFSSSQEPFFGIGADVLPPRKFGNPLSENIDAGAQYFSTLQTPAENFLVSCGNWENSFQLTSLNDGRMVQCIRQHKDVVSCVAVTAEGNVIATGSHDTTVMVWEVYHVKAHDKRIRTLQGDTSWKETVVAETPIHIFCGHDDIITCLYISMELDIVISGSKDGTCIFHTLREGRYVRSIQHPTGCALSKLVASRHGRILLYAYDDLSMHLYSINGKLLASSESNGRLNCIELSSCGEFVVCGSDQGQIVVRSMNSLEIVQRYSGVGKAITSLVVTPEECFVAGTKDGSLLVYSIENPRLQKSSNPRSTKSKLSSSG
ncbi:hypothetical protein MLD38_000993 [Melastoma candidum]|uniref:Uncharacterized protein n=1 Tax=Melastoma candidum TaxID=119954 RepID=A0ACB9SKF8_9MYRT|nr:hypothetical protein MLD38_000993 [Melastoma candidum]